MSIILKIIVLCVLIISCKNKETEIIELPPTNVDDGIKIEKITTTEQHKDESQKDTILYRKKGIEGVIFTKKYYKNSPKRFTPTKQQIDEIEELILQESEDFSNYYRQYDGIQYNDRETKRIDIQLIPKDWVEKGDHKEWREHRIAITNLTASYDLNTKELWVPELSGIRL